MLSEPYDIDPFCLSPLTLCAGRMQAVLEGTPIYRSSVYTCYQYSLILSILYVLVFFCSKILPCFSRRDESARTKVYLCRRAFTRISHTGRRLSLSFTLLTWVSRVKIATSEQLSYMLCLPDMQRQDCTLHASDKAAPCRSLVGYILSWDQERKPIWQGIARLLPYGISSRRYRKYWMTMRKVSKSTRLSASIWPLLLLAARPLVRKSLVIAY